MHEDVRASRLRISRRRALELGGTIGLTGVLAACGSTTDTRGPGPAGASASPADTDLVALLDKANTCGVTKAEIEGPYWFDVDSIRSDIREDRPGTPFALALRVRDAACAPTAKAVVEIWNCDAGGIYSGFEEKSRKGDNKPSLASFFGSKVTSNGAYSVGDAESATGDDATYLRGAQVTDATGIAQFTTIFPGWYVVRTVHVHVKVHVDKKTVLTTQLYVDDALTDRIQAASPYSAHTGRDTNNAADNYFDAANLFSMQQTQAGWQGVINIGIGA